MERGQTKDQQEDKVFGRLPRAHFTGAATPLNFFHLEGKGRTINTKTARKTAAVEGTLAATCSTGSRTRTKYIIFTLCSVTKVFFLIISFYLFIYFFFFSYARLISEIKICSEVCGILRVPEFRIIPCKRQIHVPLPDGFCAKR